MTLITPFHTPFHVAIVLGRSSSMASIRNEAIRAVNGYVAGLKADEPLGAAATDRAL